MTARPTLRTVVLACVLLWASLDVWPAPANAAGKFPSRLTDRAFWTLVSDLSEPDGHFRSDNLLSNEIWYEQALGL
ncbi:MAG: hypothetical protein ABUS56_03760, partial [Acidobacteriota bacterium]